MKTTIQGFITWEVGKYSKKPRIDFMTCDPRQSPAIWPDMVVVREHSFEVEIPDDFDPRPTQIANLHAQAIKARADFEARITDINRQISELQALEHTA